MANTIIQIKSSGVTGNVPQSLQPGELAINYVDGKLFYGNSASQSVLFDVITEPSGLNGELQFNNLGSLGSDATLTFDTSSKSLNVNVLTANSYVQFPDGTRQYTANADGILTQSAFDQANTANTQAWIAYDEAVNANTWVRQRADAASSYANGAFDQANSAIVLAQAAFDQANTANSTSGGSDLTTILTTLYSPPSGDFGLVTQSNYSQFGEFIAISYDLKTTFPEGNGLLEVDWGAV